jgi:HlyD family secretion protein
MQIRAPAAAMVETLELYPGDLVRPGQGVATLLFLRAPWIRCYVPQNQLGQVAAGMAVGVSVDSFPGEAFPGVIRWISAEAEFTPRNVQTYEKRAELMFEMKVDITDQSERLRPGMYADVRVAGSPQASP